ncbi:MAG: DUF2955 domain-containing protein [Steroidobacteraceae bacterium]
MQTRSAQQFDPARTHATLRFAFGVTVAFVVSELMQWVPTFLAPVLVAVVLVNVPIRPPLKVAVGLIAIVAATALIALLLSTALLPTPLLLFGAAAVVVFRTLYVIAEGRPRVAPLFMLMCVTTIPVIALESPSIAGSFGYALVRSTGVAILVAWTAHLLWPRIPPPRSAARPLPLPPDARLKSALLGTAILTPLMLVYLLFGLTNALPVLVATSMIVMNLDFRQGRMQALALVAGNLGGGIVALVMFVLIAVQPSLIFLCLITVLTGLAYGWRTSAGDPMAAVVLVACNATFIVFSSALASDTGTVDFWITRLTQFVIAGAFAIGMMTLLWTVKEQPTAPTPTPSST